MKKIMFALIVLIGSSLMSCKKEGCTDPDAVNHDSDAKTDDGSCTYQAEFIVYFNEVTATNLTNDGITELSFYLGDKAFGTLTPSDFTNVIPECGGSEGLTTTVDLGTTKDTHEFELKYLDNMGVAISYGTYPGITANKCRKYEITYYN